jgi:outer membrane murein-binding lipoprotein Lpp
MARGLALLLSSVSVVALSGCIALDFGSHSNCATNDAKIKEIDARVTVLEMKVKALEAKPGTKAE